MHASLPRLNLRRSLARRVAAAVRWAVPRGRATQDRQSGRGGVDDAGRALHRGAWSDRTLLPLSATDIDDVPRATWLAARPSTRKGDVMTRDFTTALAHTDLSNLRRQAHERQRARVVASLLVIPAGAKPSHRCWAEPSSAIPL